MLKTDQTERQERESVHMAIKNNPSKVDETERTRSERNRNQTKERQGSSPGDSRHKYRTFEIGFNRGSRLCGRLVRLVESWRRR